MRTRLPILVWTIVVTSALQPPAAPHRAAARPATAELIPAKPDLVAPGGAPDVLAADVDPARADYYIVLLADPALASYRGGIQGLAPTSPAATGDAMLDPEGAASLAYLDHLARVQRDALARVERTVGHPVAVLDHYRHALNGFALWLTPAEARRVQALPGIVHVERRTVERLATDAGPAWSGARGVWDGSALGRPTGSLGEGVVVGIVDTGVNIDHPSFAAVDGEGYEHANPRGAGKYLGWCDPGHPRYRSDRGCNDKLIGLWSHASSNNDPEDDNGHGSHTASTAAGNRIAAAALVGPTITVTRTISGVAPHANVVMYDACVNTGCDSTATTAAINQAVADRVDVLNYSIEVGQDSPWRNSRSLAFLGAREAGVFVAVAAGNAGPGAGTVGANAPWVLTVGNNTHNRKITNRLVSLSGGSAAPPGDLDGKGFTAGTGGPRPIVYAKGLTAEDGTRDDGRCLKPLRRGSLAGKIVVCDRGEIARVAKGDNAKAGGAAGLVLVNLAADGESLVGDAHALPAVHIGFEDGNALKAWLERGSNHRAEIAGLAIDEAPANGDVMSSSSSRGPTRAAACCPRPDVEVDRPVLLDVLKPDVTAPGTDVLAAVATGGDRPAPEFDLLSGTSMASPHAAGAAALLRAVHPTWSPAAVASALMTTARSGTLHEEDETTPADPFDRGAGHIDIARAARAGFVVEETAARFRAADPSRGGGTRSLNIASLHDTACLLTCVWERTLTSAHGDPVAWTTSAPGPSSLPVTVDPPSFTLQPGGRQTVRITADVSGLTAGLWSSAEVVFTPDTTGVPEAHMPLTVRAVPAKLPAYIVIQAEEPAGTRRVPDLRTIEITDMARQVHGLVKGGVYTKTLVPDFTPGNPFNDPDTTLVVTTTVPANSRRLVAEVVGSTARDIDLYLIRDNGAGIPAAGVLACNSGGPSWREICDVIDPAPGRWWAVAHDFTGSDNPPDETKVTVAVVPPASVGNLTVTGPAAVPAGEPFDLDLAWDLPGLQVGDRWYGALSLGTEPGQPAGLGVIPIDLIGVVAGTVPTATPTAGPPSTTPTPTRTPTPTDTATPSPTPTPTATPVARPVIYLPAALRESNMRPPTSADGARSASTSSSVHHRH